MNADPRSWYPVVPSRHLRAGENIVAGFVNGEELALWRSEHGTVQAWENRCPHRGTRLTLGRVLDGRLTCAYHGWEFEADTARCVAIPAHPDMPAPPSVRVKTWRAAEAQGMVWVAGEDASPDAASPAAGPSEWFCRSLGIRVSVGSALNALGAEGFTESPACVWHGELGSQAFTLYLTAAQPHLTLVHAWIDDEPDPARLKQAMAALRQWREAVESAEPAATNLA